MAQNISSVELRDKLKHNTLLNVIDIRENYEFEICAFVPTNIPMYTVQSYLSTENRSAEIILVCKTGKRACALANILECEEGFSNIFILEGGIMAWIENIDPTLEIY
jgi:rhodanese-related sulfurtransferase